MIHPNIYRALLNQGMWPSIERHGLTDAAVMVALRECLSNTSGADRAAWREMISCALGKTYRLTFSDTGEFLSMVKE